MHLHIGLPSAGKGLVHLQVGLPSAGKGLMHLQVGVRGAGKGLVHLQVGLSAGRKGLVHLHVGFPGAGKPPASVFGTEYAKGPNDPVSLLHHFFVLPMKLFPALALATALFAAGTAQAQTKVKTKTRAADGTTVKTSTTAPAVTLDGPVKRVETLSGIDVFPKPNSTDIMLSFTQQFTKPGTLVMTDYKNQVMYQTALDPASNTGAPVNLGKIPAGTYLVEAKTGNYVYWKKVRIKYPVVRR